jgi:hypothetical protein
LLVAPSSSSTKKAARLAKSGQGKKVRFQGGTLYPAIVAIVIVLGLGLIYYSRHSQGTVQAANPAVGDQWHIAYGFYLCDQWFKLEGDLSTPGEPGFNEFARTGVNSKSDGVIYWHPESSASAGTAATLSVFLANYGVTMSDTELVFPAEQRANLPSQADTGTFEEGTTKCDIDGQMKDGELKVVTWDNYADTGKGTTYVAAFPDIRINKDEMVVSMAFVPPGTDVSKPPWAADLPKLVAAGGATTTTVPGASTTVGASSTGTASTTVPTGPTTTGG